MRLLRSILLVTLLGAAVAAGVVWLAPAGETLVPYYRFVEGHLQGSQPERWWIPIRPRLQGGTTAFVQVAVLQDETRFVLDAPVRDVLVRSHEVAVPRDGKVVLRAAPSGALAEAERLLVMAQVKRADRWRPLRRRLVDVERTQPPAELTVELVLPPADRGRRRELWAEALVVPAGDRRVRETVAVRIPRHARLEVAFGVPPAAWREGPSEFRLQSCHGSECELLLSEIVDPARAEGRGWHERTVALEHLAWRRRSFRFESRALSAGAVHLASWANPTVYAPTAAPGRNVVLISLDTLAADHLPLYGYGPPTAPFLSEAFGEGGTVFERCVAASATTPPSHMTMFTSVQPCVHGTTSLQPAPTWLLTLAEVLRGQGYETAAVTEDGWLGALLGFARGFDEYAENRSAELGVPEGHVESTFTRARRWLEQNREKRFFLFVHTYQVHRPYTPPPRYRGLFGGAAVTDASPAHLRERVAYDQEIRYVDDQLRRLFATFRGLGLERDTVVIVTSDHGEEFLEHGQLQHGAQLYEEVTHVPLLFWGAGVPSGLRIAETVGHIDLMPTILALAHSPEPEQMQGRSLLPLVETRAPGSPAARAVAGDAASAHYSEAWSHIALLAGGRARAVEPPGYLVQRGPHKLHRYRAGPGHETAAVPDPEQRLAPALAPKRSSSALVYEAYDLTTDSEERRNLYGSGAPFVAELRPLVDLYEQACLAQRIHLTRGLPPEAAGFPAEAELDPAQKEKLRALGYLE